MLIFFTGFSRNASDILREQDKKSKKFEEKILRNLNFVKDLGMKSKDALEKSNLREFGRIMDAHWSYKKERSNAMSNELINGAYDIAMVNGALGGKLIGAGGGGFMLFYCPKKNHKAFKKKLKHYYITKFNFTNNSSRIIHASKKEHLR